MNEISVRKFRLGDEPAISRIIFDTEHYCNMPLDRKTTYEANHSVETLTRFIKEKCPEIFIAEIESSPVGVGIRLEDRLLRLHIAQDAIRSGIGSILFKEMAEGAKQSGYKEAWLKTLRESSAAAIALIKKLGFEIISIENHENSPGSITCRIKL